MDPLPSLLRLNARLTQLVEFARGDQAIAYAARNGWLNSNPVRGSSPAQVAATTAFDLARNNQYLRLAKNRNAKMSPSHRWTRSTLATSIRMDRHQSQLRRGLTP
jgi:hypothetical protein